jgi:hypothetical protein
MSRSAPAAKSRHSVVMLNSDRPPALEGRMRSLAVVVSQPRFERLAALV